MDYVLAFLEALGLTLTIELGVLLLITKARPLKSVLFAGMLATSSTLPYLWFVLPELIPSYGAFLWVGELSIVIIEACIYSHILRINYLKAFYISFLCNLASFLFGVLLQHQY